MDRLTLAVRPWVEQEVQNAVREIPFQVRKELEYLVEGEMASIIRQHVRDRLVVNVEVNG